MSQANLWNPGSDNATLDSGSGPSSNWYNGYNFAPNGGGSPTSAQSTPSFNTPAFQLPGGMGGGTLPQPGPASPPQTPGMPAAATPTTPMTSPQQAGQGQQAPNPSASSNGAAQAWADGMNAMMHAQGINSSYSAAQWPGATTPGVTAVGNYATNGSGAVPSASPTNPTGSNPLLQYFGGVSPFNSNVTGSINGQTTGFNPGAYTTLQGAQTLGKLFGGNVVSQNLNGMASPGSTAPSAPMYGVDYFGSGDPVDSSYLATEMARGLTPDQIKGNLNGSLQAQGLGGWGGVAPTAARNDDLYNWSTPVGTNASQFNPQSSPSAFSPYVGQQFDPTKTNAAAQGQGLNTSNYTGTSTGQVANGELPPFQNTDSSQAAMAFLSAIFGPQAFQSMLDQGRTTRQPNLLNGRNSAFMHNYYYPNTEPNYSSQNGTSQSGTPQRVLYDPPPAPAFSTPGTIAPWQ